MFSDTTKIKRSIKYRSLSPDLRSVTHNSEELAVPQRPESCCLHDGGEMYSDDRQTEAVDMDPHTEYVLPTL
jgi:hypothetical protein